MRLHASLGAVLTLALISSLSHALDNSIGKSSAPSAAPVQAHLTAAYGKLPLAFEANQGQADSSVRFVSRGAGYTLFLTSDEAVLTLKPAGQDRNAASGKSTPAVLRMKLLGANPNPKISHEDELEARSNYFSGQDPTKWRTEVPNYGKVRYGQLYPGIDLVYYGNQGRLEHDYVVSPGADPARIAFTVEGASRLHVDRAGDLVIETGQGSLRLARPVAYQTIGGARRPVQSEYVLLASNKIGFKVSPYNREQPLVIDPVLLYSTFLGGYKEDEGRAIAVDASGSAYVTGYTYSTNFPASGAVQSSLAGNDDVFITKFKANGSGTVYSTYLGGSSNDWANAIAVDASGNVYVTGETSSNDFPTLNALQPSRNSYSDDAFITKLNASGSSLVYSTYLGGSYTDSGSGIAVDSAGAVYVAGTTSSSDFPVAKPLQKNYGGYEDAFVAKLKADGSGLLFSSYLGGSDGDNANAIAVDASKNVYVVGYTYSADFPVVGALQSYLAGSKDAFVVKIKADLSDYTYSTYLGGAYQDIANAVAVDSAGNAYVAGQTSSSDFPLSNAYQQYESGDWDVFVTKVAKDGSSLIYSTYLGGSYDDVAQGIAVDTAGYAYVAGQTYSTNFPSTVDAVSRKCNAGTYCYSYGDAFVTKLAADGSGVIYSTFIGGADKDYANAIAVDVSGNAYITGKTYSSDFPTTTGAFQSKCNNGSQCSSNGDAFVAKIGLYAAAQPTFSPGAGTYTAATSVTLRDATKGAVIYYTTDGTTPTSASTKYTAAIKVLYTTTIQAIAVAPGYASSVVATGLFNIKASDLTEVAVADPPATAVVGKSFSVADAVVNLGGATSPASVTQYYLSTTAAKGGYLLTGSRAVPALKAKDVSVGFTTVTVPAGTAAGVYYLVACADNTSAAAESNESNNCIASFSTVTIAGADLVETAVSNPPSRVSPSLTFSVSDTVKNQGKGAAAASTTRYYLSTTASKTAKSILLSGTRSVPALAAGAASTSTVNVKTPSALASGIYYLVACADDLSAISETIESNNCKVSAAITTR